LLQIKTLVTRFGYWNKSNNSLRRLHTRFSKFTKSLVQFSSLPLSRLNDRNLLRNFFWNALCIYDTHGSCKYNQMYFKNTHINKLALVSLDRTFNYESYINQQIKFVSQVVWFSRSIDCPLIHLEMGKFRVRKNEYNRLITCLAKHIWILEMNPYIYN